MSKEFEIGDKVYYAKHDTEGTITTKDYADSEEALPYYSVTAGGWVFAAVQGHKLITWGQHNSRRRIDELHTMRRLWTANLDAVDPNTFYFDLCYIRLCECERELDRLQVVS